MKKMFLTVLAIITVVSISFAQSKPLKQRQDPEKRAEAQTQRMTEKLGLSKEQAEKIKAINLESARKMEALHDQSSADKQALGKQRKTIQQERDEKISAVLDAKQKEQYEKMKAEVKQNHGADHDHPHPHKSTDNKSDSK